MWKGMLLKTAQLKTSFVSNEETEDILVEFFQKKLGQFLNFRPQFWRVKFKWCDYCSNIVETSNLDPFYAKFRVNCETEIKFLIDTRADNSFIGF